MHQIKNVLAAVAFSALSVGVAHSQSMEREVGPWWNYFNPIMTYKADQMAMMKPEDQHHVMEMQDKMAMKEMEFRMSVAKMEAQHEMEMAKMRREMIMYINSVYPPVGPH